MLNNKSWLPFKILNENWRMQKKNARIEEEVGKGGKKKLDGGDKLRESRYLNFWIKF